MATLSIHILCDQSKESVKYLLNILMFVMNAIKLLLLLVLMYIPCSVSVCIADYLLLLISFLACMF